MPSPNARPTPITPPRVDFIDPRTGSIDRAWFLFLLSLNQIANDAVQSTDSIGPDSASLIASLSAELAALAQFAETLPPPIDLSDELIKQIQALGLADCCSALVSQVAELQKEVEGLQMAPPPRQFAASRYGLFYDTTTQTADTINTAKAITFNTTDLSSGVFLGSPTSRIIVDTPGIYNFQTSIQLDSTVSSAQQFYLWFRLNGVDVTNSASQLRTQGNNAEIFVALNYFFNLKANDYVELMYSVSDLGVQLLASGAVAPHPGIPSVILTVSNNIGGFQ